MERSTSAGWSSVRRCLLSLTGGNLAAQAINLQAGTGAIQADVNNVTGAVNVSGGSAQFASDAGVLDLGSLDMAGDPTFFNMGDIRIDGDIMVGQSLAILATGNVTASRAVVIKTRDASMVVTTSSIVAGGNLQRSGSPTGSATIPPKCLCSRDRAFRYRAEASSEAPFRWPTPQLIPATRQPGISPAAA